MKPYLLLIAAGLMSQPLIAAQPESDLQATETRRLLHAYGACVVKRQEARAAQAIVANIDNGELLRRYGSLIDGTCLPARMGRVQVRFQGDQYRYALADALARKQYASTPAPALDIVPRLQHRDPGAEPARVTAKGRRLKEKEYQAALREFAAEQAYSYLSRYGECVVRVNPAAARDLLLTEPGTPQETERFAALRTAFGSCLREDQKLSLGKLALRGTIAINYYRLARAAGLGGVAR